MSLCQREQVNTEGWSRGRAPHHGCCSSLDTELGFFLLCFLILGESEERTLGRKAMCFHSFHKVLLQVFGD